MSSKLVSLEEFLNFSMPWIFNLKMDNSKTFLQGLE